MNAATLHPRLLLCSVLTWSLGTGLWAGEDLVRNPSAEQLAEGKPVAWGLYRGKGKSSLFVSTDAHTGQRSAGLRVEAPGSWRGGAFFNCGLVQGCDSGYVGRDAYPTEPGTVYRVSFWLKGTVPWVTADSVCWTTSKAKSRDRIGRRIVPGKIVPTDQWRKFSAVFVTPPKAKRLALKWHVAGFQSEGMRPGVVLVDDVELSKIGSTQPAARPRLRIPKRVHVTVMGRSLEDLLRSYRSGDERVCEYVERALAAGERWASKPDAWYVERVSPHTPLGMWTLACPFHPERVRDFSKDNFEWSIDQPWRLVCKLCKAEGRRLHYYPNERYPDNGRGCRPADEIWAADHDAAWSRAHSNIPHDHWDGKPHGYSASGYCYHFMGKCAHEIMTFMAKRTLAQLARGYVLAKALKPDDSLASRCARRVKVAMLMLARSHMGDAYLADAANLSQAEFDTVVGDFLGPAATSTRFPGYTPYDLQDGVLGDKEHPATRRTDIYGDGSYRGDTYARGWLKAYAYIRDSFGDDEEIVRGLIERLLLPAEGDAKALSDGQGQDARRVKRGKLQLALKPFNMSVGASNNLGGRELANQFDLGVLLADTRIVDAVVDNTWFYLRNYFNSDGLGRETSPAYTNCAWNSMWGIFSMIYGYRGHYDQRHPWWDEDLGGLNPYRDPILKHDAAKIVYCMLPDGTSAPWMDSHVGHGPGMRYVDLAANEGGGLPPEYADLYLTKRLGDRVSPRPQPDRLESMLLHESKKAVLRTGVGGDSVFMSIDYAPNTGHWHPAPMDLLLYAKGHELASDLGYFGAMHWLTKDWIHTCEAHNTCIVRTDDGRHEFMHEVQGEMRTLFEPGERVSVVEVCERDEADLRHIPGERPAYQRTCALVSVGSGTDHYVLDVFRVRGGTWHDYYFHSQGRQCAAAGLELKALDPATSLHDASGFPKQKRPQGDGLIRRLRRGRTSSACQVTWRGVADYRQSQATVDEAVGLCLTLLNDAESDIFLGQAPGQRRMSSADLHEPLHVLCARRPNRGEVDAFVAVIEPFRDATFVQSVRQLPVAEAAGHAVAVRVDVAGRTDFLVSIADLSGDGARAKVDLGAGRVLDTDGLLTIVSIREGRPVFLGLYAGTRASAGTLSVSQGRPWTGVVEDFDHRGASLTVHCDGPLPDGDALRGETIIIEHPVGTTTFTIDSVTARGQGRYVIALARAPHLMENYLRVTQSAGSILAVEPPPSLPARLDRMGYQVYRIEPKGRAVLVGQVHARSGGTLSMDAAAVDIALGDVIGLTRIRKGRDRFRVVASATVGEM